MGGEGFHCRGTEDRRGDHTGLFCGVKAIFAQPTVAKQKDKACARIHSNRVQPLFLAKILCCKFATKNCIFLLTSPIFCALMTKYRGSVYLGDLAPRDKSKVLILYAGLAERADTVGEALAQSASVTEAKLL